jgi:uncharacterized protein YycO
VRRLFATRRLLPHVEVEQVEHFTPGFGPAKGRPARPGDFILTHGAGFVCWAIRFGQGLWIHGSDRPYTYWNHAALVVDDAGGLVEALSDGVKATNLSKYLGSDYHLVRIKATTEDRDEIARFGKACVGDEYGYLTIVSIAVTILLRSKITFFVQGEQICSGLVARAQERGRAIFDRNPVSIMPADLAKYYGVTR